MTVLALSEGEAIIPEIQSESLTYKMPIIEALKEAALRYQETAEALKIENNDDFLTAGALRDSGIKFQKVYWGLLNPGCQELDALHSKAVERRDAVCDPYAIGSKTAKQRMISYEQQAERQRQIEQAKIDAENQRKADEDKLALAEELEKAGLKEEADEAIQRPPEMQQTIIPRGTPKIAGFSARSHWTFYVYCKSCKIKVKFREMGNHKKHDFEFSNIPREYMLPDFSTINAIVSKMGAATNIPDIEPCEEKV
jgi:hypothetical protein